MVLVCSQSILMLLKPGGSDPCFNHCFVFCTRARMLGSTAEWIDAKQRMIIGIDCAGLEVDVTQAWRDACHKHNIPIESLPDGRLSSGISDVRFKKLALWKCQAPNEFNHVKVVYRYRAVLRPHQMILFDFILHLGQEEDDEDPQQVYATKYDDAIRPVGQGRLFFKESLQDRIAMLQAHILSPLADLTGQYIGCTCVLCVRVEE